MRNIPKLAGESYYLMTKLAVLLVQRYNELVEENVEEAHEIPTGFFLFFLSSRKRPLRQHFNKSTRFLFKFRVIYNTSASGSLTCTYADLFCDGQ